MSFTQSDIWDLPFKEGDLVKYKDEEVTINSIYIRPYTDFINDIIVTFSNGDYTFHDDFELQLI